MNAHWTPGAAAQSPLFTWWARFAGPQHAFREGRPWRSLCDGLRWTTQLEQDSAAPVCGDCRRIVWSLTEAARDHVVAMETKGAA